MNGILSFMLTPGDWLETHDIQDAFFNATFLPSTFMRSCVSIALAGLYALMTAALLRDEDLRAKMIRYAARWLVPAFLLLPIGGLWYAVAIPSDARELLQAGYPVLLVFLFGSVGISALIFGYGWFGAALQPRRFSLATALVLLTMGLAVTGTSEFMREAIRKPYIIYDYMYANSIRVEDSPAIQAEGALASSKWAKVSTVTPQNRIQAGKEVFRLLCSSCHTVDGYNAIRPFIQDWPEDYIYEQLSKLNVLASVMPPFQGNAAERDALAGWLATLGDKEPQP